MKQQLMKAYGPTQAREEPGRRRLRNAVERERQEERRWFQGHRAERKLMIQHIMGKICFG